MCPPGPDVVRLGCARGKIKGPWQEGRNVGVIVLQSKTKDHDHIYISQSPEIIPKSEAKALHIDEKSRAEFLCGCPIRDFMEIQLLYLTN